MADRGHEAALPSPAAWMGTTAQRKTVTFDRRYTPTVSEIRTRLAGTAEITERPGESMYCIDVSTLLQELDRLTIEISKARREAHTNRDAIEAIAHAMKEANIHVD